MTSLPKSLNFLDYVDPNFPFDIALAEIQATYPLHRHDFIECAYVIDGKGIEIINGKEHPVKFGTFTFLLPYQMHELHAEKGEPLRLYSCGLDMSLLTSSVHFGLGVDDLLECLDESASPFFHFEGAEASRMENIFQQIYTELNSNNKWRFALIRAKIIEALVFFDRARRDVPVPSNQAITNSSSSKEEIWDIVQFIHAHFYENITLSSISAKFHLSAPYLSAVFRKHLGSTFTEVLNGTRILHAASLLATTDANVTDIALSVGYKTYSSFSRAFHQKKGIGPSDYRKLRGVGTRDP